MLPERAYAAPVRDMRAVWVALILGAAIVVAALIVSQRPAAAPAPTRNEWYDCQASGGQWNAVSHVCTFP